MARKGGDKPRVADMSDEELSAHLRELHDWQAELLEDIDAASKEVERRSSQAQEAAVVASLPENVRGMLRKQSGLPQHVRHALVEAESAGAGAAGTEVA